MKTRSIFSALLIFIVLLAACSSASPTPQAVQPTQASQNNPAPVATTAPAEATAPAVSGSNIAITISNFAFDPSPLTVKVGTTVTWTNQDSASHNVVADNGAFKSNTLKQGDTFSFTFNQAGTYNYYCSFHGGPNEKGMSGQIIVTQ
jgi:plastocyanin